MSSHMYKIVIPVIISLLMITSCAENKPVTPVKMEPVPKKTVEDQKLKQIKQKEAELKQKEAELRALQEKLGKEQEKLEMEKAKLKERETELQQKMEVTPPFTANPKPGECYAVVYIPPKYKTKKVKVLVDEGGEKIITKPPVYKWVEKKVLVKEGGEKKVCIPPVYKTIDDSVLLKPSSEKIVVVKPAKYKWVIDSILVKPEHTVWKRGERFLPEAIEKKFDPNTGEIMCLIKVPAKYKIVKKRIMISPPVTKRVEIPPVYKKIKKRVIIKPAEVKVVKIPPVYKTVKVKELIEPASAETVKIEPKYKWVTQKILVKPGKYDWVRVLCKTNMSKDKIITLQKELKRRGYYKGPIDGIFGPLTYQAVINFQKDNNLARGALTCETLEVLKIGCE